MATTSGLMCTSPGTLIRSKIQSSQPRDRLVRSRACPRWRNTQATRDRQRNQDLERVSAFESSHNRQKPYLMIYNAVTECMRALQSKGGATNDFVEGVGISSTYSFAIKGFEGNLVYASKAIWIVKMERATLWAGHRAENEASAINATGPIVLDYAPGFTQFSLVMVS